MFLKVCESWFDNVKLISMYRDLVKGISLTLFSFPIGSWRFL